MGAGRVLCRLLPAVLLLAAVLTGAAAATAATLTVCGSGCAFTSISSAVAAAAPGDTVSVGPGTYTEYNIVVNKPLTIDGAGAGKTIIDGGGGTNANRQVLAITPLAATSGSGPIVISDLTVQNTPVNQSGVGFGVSVRVTGPTTGISAIDFNGVDVVGRSARDFGFYIGSGITAGVARQSPPVTITDSSIQGQGASGVLFDEWRGPVTVTDSDLHAGLAPGTNPALFGFSEQTSSPRIASPYLIRSNSFHGAAVAFQTLYAGSGGFDQITVQNNLMTDMHNADPGVYLVSGVQPVTRFGTVQVTGNTMTGDGSMTANTTGVRLSGLATDVQVTGNNLAGLARAVNISANAGASPTAVAVHLNRIFGDVFGIANSAATAVDATENWWGCNAGPTFDSSSCSPAVNSGAGTVDTSSWVVATASAAQSALYTGRSTKLTVSLAQLNTGPKVSLPTAFGDVPVELSAPAGQLSPRGSELRSGTATVVYTAGHAAACPLTITMTVDAQTFQARAVTGEPISMPLCVRAAPPSVKTSSAPSSDPQSTTPASSSTRVAQADVASAARLPDTGAHVRQGMLLALTLFTLGGLALVAGRRRRRARHRA